jgi:hypothetical protein
MNPGQDNSAMWTSASAGIATKAKAFIDNWQAIGPITPKTLGQTRSHRRTISTALAALRVHPWHYVIPKAIGLDHQPPLSSAQYPIVVSIEGDDIPGNTHCVLQGEQAGAWVTQPWCQSLSVIS